MWMDTVRKWIEDSPFGMEHRTVLRIHLRRRPKTNTERRKNENRQ
jgi:hypothetical protein